MINNYQISERLRDFVINSIIEPTYKDDLKENITLRKKFKRVGLQLEIASKIFVGISSILSFSSGVFKDKTLAFVAGTTSVVSLVFLQFSSYAYGESKKNNAELNSTLNKLNLNLKSPNDKEKIFNETITTALPEESFPEPEIVYCEAPVPRKADPVPQKGCCIS